MNKPWALRSLGLVGELMAGSETADTTGHWLSEYDPEYAGGIGAAWWSEDVDEALRFATPFEAISLVAVIPNSKKIRPDGKPNRPLSAYSLEVVNLEEKKH